MIDEKLLIKKLKKNSVFDKITNSEGKNIYEIIECLPKVDQWISVEERLPKSYEKVLVTIICNKNIYCDNVAYIDVDGKWRWSLDCNEAKVDIIAWQPLPAPYKGVNEDVE